MSVPELSGGSWVPRLRTHEPTWPALLRSAASTVALDSDMLNRVERVGREGTRSCAHPQRLDTQSDLCRLEATLGDNQHPAGRIPVPHRTDPGVGSMTAVNAKGESAVGRERVFYLMPEALAAFRGLRTRAMSAGFSQDLFVLTSAYRSATRQTELAAQARAQYGNKEAGTWVAQDKSEHITGRAFDLNLGIENTGANAKCGAFEALESYRWLRRNAADFGLNAYSAEPWHWSYNVLPRK